MQLVILHKHLKFVIYIFYFDVARLLDYFIKLHAGENLRASKICSSLLFKALAL